MSLMIITARSARIVLSFFLIVLLLSVGAGSAAAAGPPSDLRVSGKIIASSGDQLTLRLSLTNLGPGVADAQNGYVAPAGAPAFEPFGFSVELDGHVEAVSPPPECRPDERFFKQQYGTGFRCFLGDQFAPGETRTVVVVVRDLGSTFLDLISYASAEHGYPGLSQTEFNDPNPQNDSMIITVPHGGTALAPVVKPALSFKKKQTLSKKHNYVVVKASCSAPCKAVKETGEVKVGSKTIGKLTPATNAVNGTSVPLKLKLAPTVVSKALKALAAGKKVTVPFSIAALDAGAKVLGSRSGTVTLR